MEVHGLGWLSDQKSQALLIDPISFAINNFTESSSKSAANTQ